MPFIMIQCRQDIRTDRLFFSLLAHTGICAQSEGVGGRQDDEAGQGQKQNFFGKISSGPMTDSHGIIVHGLGAAVLTVRTSSAV